MEGERPMPDLAEITRGQQKVWGAGDFSRIAVTSVIVGERLCETVDLRPGERVLDVAAGSGNTSLAAARRWCDVIAIDFVPELLETAKRRADCDGLPLTVQVADCHDLPFEDGSFDVVLSSFGAMFAADQERTAAELARVCRPGGRIGMANWTPASLVGDLFQTTASHVPPPSGIRLAVEWGDEQRTRALFGERVTSVQFMLRQFVFRYRSAQHFVDYFGRWYGPIKAAFDALDTEDREALARDLRRSVEKHNRSGNGILIAPGEYAEVIAIKA
jgi:ubiquinone/menaquinone biosynthesis C-methylase UbiE